LRAPCFDLSGSIYVRAVINQYDVDGPFALIDAMDHPVCATTCRVIAAQFVGQWLADPIGVVEQWSNQELCDRCRDR